MPRLSGILCEDNDDRDVVGCGDGGISLPGGCTRVSLILSPRDHSHCDDGDQHSLVSLMRDHQPWAIVMMVINIVFDDEVSLKQSHMMINVKWISGV